MHDDDDVPLAFVVKATKVKPATSEDETLASSSVPAVGSKVAPKTKEPKDKKVKDVKKEESKSSPKDSKDARKGKRPAEWAEIDKLLQVDTSANKKPASWVAWPRGNNTVMFFAASVIVIIACRIAEEFAPKQHWHSSLKDMEDPFKTLGVSKSASDVEIRNVYRKLSLQLHPDKNPDATSESKEKFVAVTKAYKILTDPVKRARWMNSENPDFTPLKSDTISLTDKEMSEQLHAGSSWLVLAYADWSSESWDIAERWEQIGRDLGRYLQVGRINCERETSLASRFNAMSVPMIYTYIDGQITTFHGEPTLANVTLFVAKAMADSISVIRDSSAGSFLQENPDKVKVMLFAPQGYVKLRLAYRAFSRRFHKSMDFAEVTFTMADTLRGLFGVDKEPAIVIVKEKGSRPLRYSGKMTYARLSHLFAQHQFMNGPRLHTHNYLHLCGGGTRGQGPCAVYLHDSSAQGPEALRHAQALLANVSAEELRAARQVEPERFATAFAWVDLASEPGLRQALGAYAVPGRVVAINAHGKSVMPFDEERLLPGALLAWGQGLLSREAGDFDALRSEVVLRDEWLPWNRRAALRRYTPQLMTVIAVVACWLLWYALQNLWFEFRDSRLKDRFRRTLDKTRQKQLEADKLRIERWQSIDEANRQAAERKRLEAAERDERRRLLEAAAADAAREAARAAEETKRRQQPPPEPPAAGKVSAPRDAPAAKPRDAPAKPAAAPGRVSEAELRAAVERLVMEGDLERLTKRGIREQLQRDLPGLDAAAHKEAISALIDRALEARAA